MSLEPLELPLVPPPDRSPGRSLAMSPTELPGKAGPRRRSQTVAPEGPGTSSLTGRREIFCWRRRWRRGRRQGDTGTADISELLAGGLTLTQPDGLLTAARTPGLAGTAEISELRTGWVTLPRPHRLLTSSRTGRWRWWRWRWRCWCWGGDGRRRDVHGETLPADVNEGVTRGVALP